MLYKLPEESISAFVDFSNIIQNIRLQIQFPSKASQQHVYFFFS